MANAEKTKELTRIKTSYKMYQNTINDVSNKLKNEPKEVVEERLGLIRSAMDDIKKQYVLTGGNEADLEEVIDISDKPIDVFDYEDSTPITEVINRNQLNDIFPDEVSDGISYDMIPLPSNGECYKNKINRLQVSYLVGADEDIISSPNLYRDGLIMDILLKRKIMSKNINAEDLLRCDRDAVILWLRANGYGSDFPVTATDPVTGENFESIVDLSKIKYKPFNLVGDENGYFDFKLPLSGDNVKFKFLSHKDEKNLEMIENIENSSIKKTELLSIKKNLGEISNLSNEISQSDKSVISQCIKVLENWGTILDKKTTIEYPHSLTNKLELSIISINENTDRNFINKYVKNMRAKDSFDLRKYINENTPGLDYNVTINKPESLGGGSLTLFLSIDEYVFLNVT